MVVDGEDGRETLVVMAMVCLGKEWLVPMVWRGRGEVPVVWRGLGGVPMVWLEEELVEDLEMALLLMVLSSWSWRKHCHVHH